MHSSLSISNGTIIVYERSCPFFLFSFLFFPKTEEEPASSLIRDGTTERERERERERGREKKQRRESREIKANVSRVTRIVRGRVACRRRRRRGHRRRRRLRSPWSSEPLTRLHPWFRHRQNRHWHVDGIVGINDQRSALE